MNQKSIEIRPDGSVGIRPFGEGCAEFVVAENSTWPGIWHVYHWGQIVRIEGQDHRYTTLASGIVAGVNYACSLRGSLRPYTAPEENSENVPVPGADRNATMPPAMGTDGVPEADESVFDQWAKDNGVWLKGGMLTTEGDFAWSAYKLGLGRPRRFGE